MYSKMLISLYFRSRSMDGHECTHASPVCLVITHKPFFISEKKLRVRVCETMGLDFYLRNDTRILQKISKK